MNEMREENGTAVAEAVDANEEKTRYSDAELEEFKLLIDVKLIDAKIDLNFLRECFNGTSVNDIKDTSPTFKNAIEEGGKDLSREDVDKLISKQEKFIQHLNSALVRIVNKTYGICRETGKLISKERLKAAPVATQCMDAKMKQKVH